MKEDEDPKVYREKTSKSWMKEWQSKPMHGQFLRQTKDLSSNDTCHWLQRGELKKETDGMIMAAQDQAQEQDTFKEPLMELTISLKCRKCSQKDKTINHIASGCPALAQNQYKKRHETVARAVHWNLCKEYQMPYSNKWYEHQKQPVTENENAKLLLDYGIRIDREIPAHQPVLTLVNKTNNIISLIDVAVPCDSKAEQKEQEKMR